MISTYLSYQSYAADLPKTLARVASEAQFRDAPYYQDNIGKVTSVDGFLKNNRLFAFAMKAHGLEDMAYAKAFMRKVLESDLGDANSFAMKLADTRYAEFARSFNFTPQRRRAAEPSLPSQNEFQQDDTVGLYSEQRIKQGVAAANEAAYYQNNMGTVHSVDELLSRPQLLNYALIALA